MVVAVVLWIARLLLIYLGVLLILSPVISLLSLRSFSDFFISIIVFSYYEISIRFFLKNTYFFC